MELGDVDRLDASLANRRQPFEHPRRPLAQRTVRQRDASGVGEIPGHAAGAYAASANLSEQILRTKLNRAMSSAPGSPASQFALMPSYAKRSMNYGLRHDYFRSRARSPSTT